MSTADCPKSVELPIGLYEGTFAQNGCTYPMRVEFKSANAKIVAFGSDLHIGEFCFSGSNDPANGLVNWIKVYWSRHEPVHHIYYDGRYDATTKIIRGTWELPAMQSYAREAGPFCLRYTGGDLEAEDMSLSDEIKFLNIDMGFASDCVRRAMSSCRSYRTIETTESAAVNANLRRQISD